MWPEKTAAVEAYSAWRTAVRREELSIEVSRGLIHSNVGSGTSRVCGRMHAMQCSIVHGQCYALWRRARVLRPDTLCDVFFARNPRVRGQRAVCTVLKFILGN